MPLILGIVVWIIFMQVTGPADSAILGLAAALVALFVSTNNKYQDLADKIDRLRSDLKRDTGTASEGPGPAREPSEEVSPEPEVSDEQSVAEAQPGVASARLAAEDNPDERRSADGWDEPVGRPRNRQSDAGAQVPRSESAASKLKDQIIAAVKGYFQDGNLFVRIGILVLFVGVAFLLKYAAEHSRIPIEYRISGVGILGIAILVFGWRLRHTKTTYGLLLQGCGIGILYLCFFSAFRIYEIVPPTFTFAMLVSLAVLSAMLAVLQDSRSMAAFGIVGGFIAPILASTGSGNYIGLFSYYLILNAGVISIAWFKAWRVINLLGFNFTYLVFVAWVVRDYETAYLMSSDPFLVLFFLIFSFASVLFALRQPVELKGYVDSTLVFANPLIAWSLQMYMIRHVEYGIAVSAFLFGLYHVSLARLLWKRHQAGMRLYSEALLSIGVVFLTLAIPYSLDGHWTSATWALEGAGILWVALRQNRKLAQYFAVVLQLGSAVVFVINFERIEDALPILNANFIGGVFIALSGLFSSWQLFKHDAQENAHLLTRVNLLVYLWGLSWWLGVGAYEIDKFLTHVNEVNGLLLLIGFSSASFWYLARRLDWRSAEITSVIAIPAIILLGCLAMVDLSHPINGVGIIAWSATSAWAFWLLRKLPLHSWQRLIIVRLHVALILFLTLLLTVEFHWRISHLITYSGAAWRSSYWMVLPLLLLSHMQRASYWPFKSYRPELQRGLGIVLVSSALLWSLAVNFSNDGDASPLPYLPFINPLDIIHMILVILSYKLWQAYFARDEKYRGYFFAAMGLVLFVWINAVQLRTIHHYFDMRFDLEVMLSDIGVQMSLSILWTVMGMLAMLVAARKHFRHLWIAGAVLVSIVLLKLIAVDLAASGTVERIVSFMAVGALLVGMGYFSPIPDKGDPEIEAENV